MSIFHWGNLKHIEKFQESHPGMKRNEEIRGFKAMWIHGDVTRMMMDISWI